MTLLPVLFWPQTAHAESVFKGPGLRGGIELARAIQNGGVDDLRAALVSLTLEVLSFVALISVIMIIIAGIFLVVGGYSEDTRIRARKIIMYTIIGMTVIMLATQLVSFIVAIITPPS